jgi:hypothetical protein
MSGHAEVRLHFAALFGQHQRENDGRTEMLRNPGKEPRACCRRVLRQRPPTLGKQLTPSLRVTILDDGQLLEQLFAIAGRFHRRKRPIEIRGVALVTIVLIPRLVGSRRIRGRAPRMRLTLRVHQASIAALLDAR